MSSEIELTVYKPRSIVTVVFSAVTVALMYLDMEAHGIGTGFWLGCIALIACASNYMAITLIAKQATELSAIRRATHLLEELWDRHNDETK